MEPSVSFVFTINYLKGVVRVNVVNVTSVCEDRYNCNVKAYSHYLEWECTFEYLEFREQSENKLCSFILREFRKYCKEREKNEQRSR